MFRKIFLKKNFLLYKFFVKIKKIVIQKSGKSNSVVIVDKVDYSDKIQNLQNDMQKFEKINLKNDGILNFAVNQQKRVDNIFKKTCCN